ncbi:MAG: cytochrome c biogenesis protein CcdA, partial [Planctomycetota bacterium]
LGGFVLNLTPCVLPVIPIKVMTISHHAGSPGKSLMLGLWMFLGVVAFWFGIGLPVALVSGFADPSMLFGIWWVTLSIGLLIAVMGVGIMGAFSIELPSNVSAISPKADSPVGSFLFGVMTAVLGLPCFGFVAGALLAGTATMPWWLVLTIFTAIGAGMGLPYLVLAAKPEWVNKIPRTGPASELVKQVMGLLLLAAAAYFIGSGVLALVGPQDLPWWGKIIHWWGVALFAAAAGLWLITRTLSISKNAAMRAAMAVIALVLGTGGVAAATSQTDKARNDFWLPYSEDALNARLAGGDVVVLDFTAEWCLNCKALEAAVLGVDPVKPLLLSTGVVPFKADLTRSDAPGWDKLTALGKTGIPTLAVFGPGTAEPWIANAYTSREVVDAIERAKGQ